VMAHRSRVIREVLEADADAAVPAGMDLWPKINAAVVSPRPRKTQLALGPFSLSRPTTLRISVAIILAAVILVAGLLWPGRGQQAAAAVLNDLAAVAALQPAPVPGTAPGYRYAKTDSMYLSMMGAQGGEIIAALVPKVRTMWIAPDGSGRIRETAGEMVFLSEHSRSAWQAAGSPPLGGAINRDFGPRGLSFEDLSLLPTDPGALANVIRERAQRADPPLYDEMFVVVGDLLREQTAPPQVRAALYKVAAGIPGVELVDQVQDRSGRQGVAVAKTSTYTGVKRRHVLIFDPTTSAHLAEEDVILEPVSWIDAKPPVVIGYATYLESGIVESLPRD
jgi:hypothetical protein